MPCYRIINRIRPNNLTGLRPGDWFRYESADTPHQVLVAGNNRVRPHCRSINGTEFQLPKTAQIVRLYIKDVTFSERCPETED